MKKYEEVEEPTAQPVTPPVKEEVRVSRPKPAVKKVPIIVASPDGDRQIGYLDYPSSYRSAPVEIVRTEPVVTPQEEGSRYCKDCERWYGWTDQCNVPACGLHAAQSSRQSAYEVALGQSTEPYPNPVDEEGQRWLRAHCDPVHITTGTIGKDSEKKMIACCHPSEMNTRHNCYFYRPKPEVVAAQRAAQRRALSPRSATPPEPVLRDVTSSKKSWIKSAYEFLRDVMKS